jgi:hypothetical protein
MQRQTKKNLAILIQIVNISKEDMENYQWTMLTHAMDFYKERTSLKKSIPEHFFTSLLNDLSIEDLITFGNLLSTKFLKP